jgi:hypothetical protein
MPPRRPTAADLAAAVQRAAQPKEPKRDDPIDVARKQRTQEYLVTERAREAALKERGYCF